MLANARGRTMRATVCSPREVMIVKPHDD